MPSPRQRCRSAKAALGTLLKGTLAALLARFPIFFYNVDEDVDSVPEDDEDKSNGGRMTKIVTTVKMTLVLMRLAMMMLLLLAAPQEANSMFFSSV